jgi:exodeoxyribonuclease VII large subunit
MTFLHNRAMANTYLTVAFKDKEAAKALGARWDSIQRQWFVPEGRDLTPFAAWLPAGLDEGITSASVEFTPFLNTNSALAVPKKGVSLSTLLAGVSQAVAQAYKAGVWVLVEVVELRANGGHVFLGVSERDSGGSVLAKTSAVIWQSTANTILPEFERATGAQLASGIKLLVRARPVFKPQHGFTLEIDAIDPEYTLGDLEARKREIRERLQAEGVFGANKRLPAPWDFNAVLVVAPAGGAGLGDFQAEANRLEKFGVCRFTYAFSRFQGEGAAREICDALQKAISTWGSDGEGQPDAVVIIRGGGAVNDLAWLNDYDLARFICDLTVPVLTGIGHERDSTVLDEVANAKFDTPSKVIAGIEQSIAMRTTEAKAYFEQVTNRSSRTVQSAKARTIELDATVRSEAIRHLANGKQTTQALINGIKVNAIQEVRAASGLALETLQWVKTEARHQIAEAKQDVPMYWEQVSLGVKHALRSASMKVDSMHEGVLERTRRDVVSARADADDSVLMVGASAKRLVRDGASRSEALMREIAGQGPEKTLKRGFALVRDETGKPITRAAQSMSRSAIEIQFTDGKVAATIEKQQ